MPKKSNQLNLSIDDEQAAFCALVYKRHKIPPSDLLRGLIDAAREHYRIHQAISFPLEVRTAANPFAGLNEPPIPPLTPAEIDRQAALTRHPSGRANKSA